MTDICTAYSYKDGWRRQKKKRPMPAGLRSRSARAVHSFDEEQPMLMPTDSVVPDPSAMLMHLVPESSSSVLNMVEEEFLLLSWMDWKMEASLALAAGLVLTYSNCFCGLLATFTAIVGTIVVCWSCGGSPSQVLSTSFWQGLHFSRYQRPKLDFEGHRSVHGARSARFFQGFRRFGT